MARNKKGAAANVPPIVPYTQNDIPIQLAFQQAMAAAGLISRDTVLADGRLHRFRIASDKPGSRNGWYVLFDGDVPSGAFGCWKRGISETWCSKSRWDRTPAEQAEHLYHISTARKARDMEDKAMKAAARQKATSIWESSSSAPANHPYLVKKRVSGHGLRLSRNALVVPLYDDAGTMHSLQFIDPEGNKRFLFGGRKKGCYFLIGKMTNTICICEGFATAASVHEATGHATACAFDAGNLLAVARALRTMFPEIKIIVCADNDENTEGNPGLTKAREAAAAVGGLLAVPPIIGDFNDLLNGEQK